MGKKNCKRDLLQFLEPCIKSALPMQPIAAVLIARSAITLSEFAQRATSRRVFRSTDFSAPGEMTPHGSHEPFRFTASHKPFADAQVHVRPQEFANRLSAPKNGRSDFIHYS